VIEVSDFGVIPMSANRSGWNFFAAHSGCKADSALRTLHMYTPCGLTGIGSTCPTGPWSTDHGAAGGNGPARMTYPQVR
jgi:hypothetical protein